MTSVYLGKYPQGSNMEVRSIEWIMLKAEEERVLAVSRYVLDNKPFHEECGIVRWEDCSLRAWLNGEFMERAFTQAEREFICTPPQSEADPQLDMFLWQRFGMETATDCISDRVFLLSSADIQTYFPGKSELFCPGASTDNTEYVRKQTGEVRGCWWLRSSMSNCPMGMIISPCDSQGISLIQAENLQGVRPAMWMHKSIRSAN